MTGELWWAFGLGAWAMFLVLWAASLIKRGIRLFREKGKTDGQV